jgi:hypothetical protein
MISPEIFDPANIQAEVQRQQVAIAITGLLEVSTEISRMSGPDCARLEHISGWNNGLNIITYAYLEKSVENRNPSPYVAIHVSEMNDSSTGFILEQFFDRGFKPTSTKIEPQVEPLATGLFFGRRRGIQRALPLVQGIVNYYAPDVEVRDSD